MGANEDAAHSGVEQVGFEFAKGARAIGRRRLKPGIVAILEDNETRRGAIRELYEYALRGAGRGAGGFGIVYRVVDENEANGIRQRLYDLMGPRRFNSMIGQFQLRGYWHVLREDYIRHAHNRHGDDYRERLHGQEGLKVEDFVRIPEITAPRHIVDAGTNANGRPYFRYEKSFDSSTIVFQELREAEDLLLFQTMRKEKVTGGIRGSE
ncbi:MAG: hypothetical protein ACHRHE_21635 [Tepidisphaerales bacterium]